MQETPRSIPGSARSTREGVGYPLQYFCVSLVAQLAKNPPAVQETWVQSLGWEDPLEKWLATHSSILAWRIPGQSMGLQRVGHNSVTFTSLFFLMLKLCWIYPGNPFKLISMFFWHFFFLLNKIYQAYLYISLPQPWNQPFLQEALFLLVNVIKNSIGEYGWPMCSRLLGCLHIWTLSEELISIYNYLPSNHKLKPIPPISIHLGSALPCLPHFLFVSPVFHIRSSSSQ